MMKRMFSAVLVSLLVSSGTLLAQGTPVQGTPAPAPAADTTKVKVTDDQTKVKTEAGKEKADKKGRKVKVRKDAGAPAMQ